MSGRAPVEAKRQHEISCIETISVGSLDPTIGQHNMDFAPITVGAEAVRSGLSILRTALGIANDAKELLPDGDQKKRVGDVLEIAARRLRDGEAAIADALGYQLCRCQFPPTPMVKVGHLPYARLSGIDMGIVLAQHAKSGGHLTGAVAVHRCPKCKQTDAPAYPDFTRDPEATRDRQAFSPLPLLAVPPAPIRKSAENRSEGWGW